MRVVAAAALALATLSAHTGRAQDRPTGQGFSFRTGVELVSVTVTVTDASGRFVPNLRAEDFTLHEDGKEQPIAHFEAERVPVSLGIAIDTSGSMIGEKWTAAEGALNRFLGSLLGPQDEVFLYRFDSRPTLVRGWTTDRAGVARDLGTVRPTGGTAMYDAVAEAIPLTDSGTRRKKALVVISDGNDTSSRTAITDLRQLIHQREVVVYAIGIDADGAYGSRASNSSSSSGGGQTRTVPVPRPFPGKAPAVAAKSTSGSSGSSGSSPRGSGRINVDALRAMTDDSGGRTEIVFAPRDLDPATAGIADELSRQYFIGYNSIIPKDGRWHTIDVRIRRGNYTIRARKGFIAS